MKYTKEAKFCTIICITEGLLFDKEFTEGEIVGVLLHEIGHIYTYSRFNEIKYNFGTALIQELQAKFSNPKYLNFFFNWYFNLKLEKNADKWAMNYIKEHQEQVEQWQEMLQENYNKIIPKFVNHMKIKYNKDLLTE